MTTSDDPTTTILRGAEMCYPVERVLFDRQDMSAARPARGRVSRARPEERQP